MKILFVTCLSLFGATAMACLSQKSVLPDGAWVYSGVVQGGRFTDSQKVKVIVSTDERTKERFLQIEDLVLDDNESKFKITQCSQPTGKGNPFTFYVSFQKLNPKTDTYQIFRAKIEALAGRPVVFPGTAGNLFSYVRYSEYSRKGMRQENQVSRYFLPGYTIGFPTYDSAGRVNLRWNGAQPEPVR